MQTGKAKSEILASIRQNLAESRKFDRVHEEHAAHNTETAESSTLVAEADLQNVSLIERFRENLLSIGGNCETVGNKSEACLLIQALIEKSGARKIAISNASLIEEIKDLLQTDAQIFQNASKEILFECDLGITGAQFGVAETGTLVLESEKECHRLTSLVPPIHVCVLDAKQIRLNLGEILETLNKNLSPTITFITGPSRTSDIELTLAIGVHGPAQLFVILIDEK